MTSDPLFWVTLVCILVFGIPALREWRQGWAAHLARHRYRNATLWTELAAFAHALATQPTARKEFLILVLILLLLFGPLIVLMVRSWS